MEIESFLNIYKGKKVLITGHTGFKGSWLSIWLNQLGAKVVGISLEPKTEKDNFVLSGIGSEIADYRADIRDLSEMQRIVEIEQPEILFHLAAQPIVLDSYNNPVYTFDTNIMGTVNLLEVFRKSTSLKTGIFITTDKCYENIEKKYAYKETDPMGGHDPYSASKGAAEIVISSYRRSYFQTKDKNIASVRAGNVIGGGDWSPYRIVVDFIKSIEKKEVLEVRSPLAVRPWQHVLEPLGGYLLLGAKMMEEHGKYDEAWNFGPLNENVHAVKELANTLFMAYEKGTWKDVSEKDKLHEAHLLALDITKAKTKLNWNPVLDFQETVDFTVEWYKNYHNSNVLELCINQIEKYTSQWKSKSEN